VLIEVLFSLYFHYLPFIILRKWLRCFNEKNAISSRLLCYVTVISAFHQQSASKVACPCLLQDRSVFEYFAYPVIKSGRSGPFLQHKSLFAFYFRIQPTVVIGRINLQHNVYLSWPLNSFRTFDEDRYSHHLIHFTWTALLLLSKLKLRLRRFPS